MRHDRSGHHDVSAPDHVAAFAAARTAITAAVEAALRTHRRSEAPPLAVTVDAHGRPITLESHLVAARRAARDAVNALRSERGRCAVPDTSIARVAEHAATASGPDSLFWFATGCAELV